MKKVKSLHSEKEKKEKMMGEIVENANKWKHITGSWIRIINIVKMSTLFNTI